MGGSEVMLMRATSQARTGVLLGLVTTVALVIIVSQHFFSDRTTASVMKAIYPIGTKSVPDRVASYSTESGNPLWTVPLNSLTATQQRPIFSPGRRPLTIAEPLPIQSTPRSLASRPSLTLLGAIAGKDDGVAIFLNGKDTIRLKIGDNHMGWILKALNGREATLQKEQTTAILELPNPPAK
jgi:general secretion pathway protein N